MMRVAGRYAVTMGPRGVVTDPLIEIEGNRITSIETPTPEKLREVGALRRESQALKMSVSATMEMRSRAATKPATAMKPLTRAEKKERERKAGKLGLLAAKAGDEFEALARRLGLQDASVRGYYVLRQRLADPKRQPNPQIAETAVQACTGDDHIAHSTNLAERVSTSRVSFREASRRGSSMRRNT